MFVLLIGDKNAVMADAMCHSQIFWKHFTFGSSKFHVWFTPRFPEGLEIMTFFFHLPCHIWDLKCLQTLLRLDPQPVVVLEGNRSLRGKA